MKTNSRSRWNQRTILLSLALRLLPRMMTFGIYVACFFVSISFVILAPSIASVSSEKDVVVGSHLLLESNQNHQSETAEKFQIADSHIIPTLADAQEAADADNEPPPTVVETAPDYGVGGQIAQTIANQIEDRARLRTWTEIYLSLMTIGFGAFLIIVLIVMGWRTGINDIFVRVFSVSVVTFSALFLIVAGYDEKQTAPVFGILGTILGYIFGRTEKKEDEGAETNSATIGNDTGVENTNAATEVAADSEEGATPVRPNVSRPL